MADLENKIACAPQIGDYHIIADIIITRCLGYKTIPCPPTTKRTLEIGSRHSPDMICTPFKTTLGNFIEATEQGANVFIMPGFGCRLGFYDILQQQILDDLKLPCQMLTLFDYIPTPKRMYTALNEVNPNLTLDDFNQVLSIVVQIVTDMDQIANYMRRHMAFEIDGISKGHFNKHYQTYLNQVKDANTVEEAASLALACKSDMESIAIQKPERPIRIGIIGEIYIVVEPSSNCNMEKWLLDNQVEVIRNFDLTQMAKAIFTIDEQIKNSGGYVNYNIGSTANDAIAQAYQMIQEGIDGIIHVKPASCSPEITAMSILQNMSQDYDTPFMYMTFDTETGEAGVHTRLEAFLDMVKMRQPA